MSQFSQGVTIDSRIILSGIPAKNAQMTVFALAVMEYAIGVSKFGKNPIIL